MPVTPKISVIMPVYNGERFLEEAVVSILDQTYGNFELIVAYDESSDQSLEIINEYQNFDNRIVLSSGKKRGLSSSLNDAIEISRGKYIARMDADDISFPQRFEKQIELMEKENLDICGCHYVLINDRGKYLDTVLTPLDDDALILYLAMGVPFAHGSVMMRKDFITENNLEYGTGARFAEDKALWIDMYKRSAKFSNVDDILFKYRETGESLSKTLKSKVRSDDERLKADILEYCHCDINSLIGNLATQIDRLNYREVEYLADLIIYNLFQKLNLKVLKFLKFIPMRFMAISSLKFLSKKIL